MKNNRRTHALSAVLVLGAILALGAAIAQENSTFYHSNVLNYTGTSQLVATSEMKEMLCDGWIFRNRSETETVYLNLNQDDGYNGPALVSDLNMWDIPPGHLLEIEDGNIKRFSAIGTDAGALKWQCSCKRQ